MRLFFVAVFLSIVVNFVLSVNHRDGKDLVIPEVIVLGEDAFMSLLPLPHTADILEIDFETSRVGYSELFESGFLSITGVSPVEEKSSQQGADFKSPNSVDTSDYYKYIVEDKYVSEQAEGTSIFGLIGRINVVPGYEFGLSLIFTRDLHDWSLFAQLKSSIPDGWINTTLPKPLEGLLHVDLSGYLPSFTVDASAQSSFLTELDNTFHFSSGIVKQLSFEFERLSISEKTEAFWLREIGQEQSNWAGTLLESVALDWRLGVFSPSLQGAVTLSGGSQSSLPTFKGRAALSVALIPGFDVGISGLLDNSEYSIYPDVRIRFAVYDSLFVRVLLSSFLFFPQQEGILLFRRKEPELEPQQGYRMGVSLEYEGSLTQIFVLSVEYLRGRLFRIELEDIFLTSVELLRLLLRTEWDLLPWLDVFITLNPDLRILSEGGFVVQELSGVVSAGCRFDFEKTSQSVIMKVEWSVLPILGFGSHYIDAHDIMSGGRMLIKTVWGGDYSGVEAGIEILITNNFGFQDLRYFFSFGLKEFWE